MRTASFILFSAGLAAVAALVGYYGFADVAGALAAMAWGVAGIAAFHLVPLVMDTLAWRRLLAPPHRLPLRELVRMRWISEAVNALLPAAQIGGDLVRVRLAAHSGIPAIEAAASMVAELTTSLLTLIAFGALGAFLFFPRQRQEGTILFAVLGIAAVLLCAFYALQRAGTFSRVSRQAARLMGQARWGARVGTAVDLDAALSAVYARRSDVLASCAWALAAWVLGAGEVWLALHFLGVPAGWLEALVLESLIQVLRNAAFPVPGALGVQEGGFVILGAALGIGPEAALALSLVKRAREIILGVPGLLVWHSAEGRRWARNQRAHGSSTGKR